MTSPPTDAADEHVGHPFSVLIVDDHAGFRSGARYLLEQVGGEVVGESDSGISALEEAARLHPDVVLLDIQMPGLDGIEVARRLLDGDASPVVVLTSSRDASEYGARLATTQGALFVAKAELTRESLARAIGAGRPRQK